MSTKVTLTFTTDDSLPTGNDIANAVRRALTVPTIKDVPIAPSIPVISKGVTVKTRTMKTRGQNPAVNPVREFAIQQGLAKPGRGRLSREAHAAYVAAHPQPSPAS